jgi:hypothetical protein
MSEFRLEQALTETLGVHMGGQNLLTRGRHLPALNLQKREMAIAFWSGFSRGKAFSSILQ